MKTQVRALRDHYGHKAGDVFQVGSQHVRALVALGRVAVVTSAPEPTQDDETPRKKRAYKRRDMQAE